MQYCDRACDELGGVWCKQVGKVKFYTDTHNIFLVLTEYLLFLCSMK